jgi:hypothetical protein
MLRFWLVNSEAYLRVSAKLNWAEEHIKNLNAATDRFRKAHPDIVVAEPHEDLGEVWHKVAYVPEIPDPIALMLGDALYNLRAALDYLAQELVVAAGNEPSGQTAFPIFDTADEYWERMGRKVKGMRQSAIEAINRIQPYEGGFSHALWQLHRLNNIDKHRVLLTIALVNSGRTMTPIEEQEFAERFKRVHGAYPTGTSRWRFRHGKEFPVPLNASDILLKVPVSEVQKDVRFSFDIAFSEREVKAGTTVFVLLRVIADQVFEVVRSMGPHLQ